MSDVTLNFKATSSKAMDVTFTVNGEKVKPDANGNVTVKVAEDGVAEITYKATAKDVTTVSTDKDGIATAEGTIYVSRKAPEYYLGDTDLDSVVSINDATEIQRYCAFITELSDVQIMCADVNLSGDATIMDVTNLQRYLAQLSCADGIGTLIEK